MVITNLFLFYVYYKQWIDCGALTDDFKRDCGLCANLFDYLEGKGLGRADIGMCLERMHLDFVNAGFDEKLPFNESKECYSDEKYLNACFANQNRIDWVDSQITRYRGELDAQNKKSD